MAISIVTKGLKIFSGLGIVATAPLITTFTKQPTITNERKDMRSIGEAGPKKEKIRHTDLKPQDVMKEVKKVVSKNNDEGEFACFWLPDQTKWELLMCVDVKKFISPLLFHYGVWDNVRQVKQVESISFSSSPATMKFIGGVSEKLTPTTRLYLTTKSQLQRKKGALIPKDQCRVVEESGKKYQLICSSTQLEKDNIILTGRVELESLHKVNVKN